MQGFLDSFKGRGGSDYPMANWFYKREIFTITGYQNSQFKQAAT